MGLQPLLAKADKPIFDYALNDVIMSVILAFVWGPGHSPTASVVAVNSANSRMGPIDLAVAGRSRKEPTDSALAEAPALAAVYMAVYTQVLDTPVKAWVYAQVPPLAGPRSRMAAWHPLPRGSQRCGKAA